VRPAQPAAARSTTVAPVRRAGQVTARLFGVAVGGFVTAVVILALATVVGPQAVSSAAGVLDVRLDIPADASLPALEQRSVMLAADGTRLALIDREVSRRVLPLSKIPKRVREAVVTAEDRKFWSHDGYDVEGIGRALVANIRAGGVAEGGSTITQQLAKGEVGSQRTLERKVAELLYAVALERRFDKPALLERYLNQVYFGSRAYGIDAAAEEYFGVEPDELTTDQAALLAGLIRSPNSADPRAKPKLARRRRNTVLAAMAEEGYLRPARLATWQRRPLGVQHPPARRTKQPHVVEAVRRELLANPALGATRAERERALYYGGLKITTTLDPGMQKAAQDAIEAYLPSGAPTGAIATIDPRTGEIKAIASGLDYRDLEYDLASQGRRQPGSAFKPFVYAEALQQGFPLKMKLSGTSPAYFKKVDGWKRNCNDDDPSDCGVENFGEVSYGTLAIPAALRQSVNTAAAQLMITVGPRHVVELADRMGIDMHAANPKIEDPSEVLANPGLVLGGFTRGTTPLEMASAYGVFANRGERVRPHLISTVTDSTGEVLYEAEPQPERVLHRVVNAAMVDLMRSVVTDGTGTGAALPSWEVAGKTGTTTDSKDAWFVGYTPVLSTAVWIGHAEGGVKMPDMTGGSTPASIWRTYMADVLEGRAAVDFPPVDLARLEDRRRASAPAKVPEVVGLTESKALVKIGRRKLVGKVREEYSAAPAGTVVWQSPNGGSSTTVGDTVLIGVSKG
ncbi:MAG: transglycosylase domain-containing protein, partial [Euzebyales bacterium]|nr:transglycosylase domain-containing protein [Euzebyales bacterium]